MPKTIRVQRRDVAKRQSDRLAKTIKIDGYSATVKRKPLASRSFYQRHGVRL